MKEKLFVELKILHFLFYNFYHHLTQVHLKLRRNLKETVSSKTFVLNLLPTKIELIIKISVLFIKVTDIIHYNKKNLKN